MQTGERMPVLLVRSICVWHPRLWTHSEATIGYRRLVTGAFFPYCVGEDGILSQFRLLLPGTPKEF